MRIKKIVLLGLMLLGALAVRAQAIFKGGQAALDRFVLAHIVYPEFSSKNCIEGTIQVSFLVKPDGTVSEARVSKGLGIDLDDEALRIVRLTNGYWTIPNKEIKVARMELPVHFRPDYAHCQSAQLNRDQAINAYRNRQELENAVTNYYENKYLGKADTTKESYIQLLKKQLGFDDALIDDVLQQARAKLKQGDKEGACADWKFIRNIGSPRADDLLAKYCR